MLLEFHQNSKQPTRQANTTAPTAPQAAVLVGAQLTGELSKRILEHSLPGKQNIQKQTT